ncbi:acid-sensing ion channel 2-like [Erinaceus europaeus]|uniref:Acid-sensing ion channel 2-like n=1 Tax=Erinaceus europaeus TaxID=9365 RepID=A0ABM3YIJ6_ERIEU|nr:acid-sensing ion channel 2-like [Erinaceus europaeus]
MDLKESPSEGSLQPSSIQIFANTSTLHGIRHIFVYGPLTIRRVLWAMAFVGSLGLLLVESSERVSYYFSYQHVTKVDEVVAQSLVFPAVTLCNLNGFRFSRLTTNDLYHAGELLALLDVNLQIPDPHLADPIVLEALRQKANFKHYKPKQFSMLEFLHRVGHDLKDMMLYCKFKGQECGHQDFTTASSSKIKLMMTEEDDEEEGDDEEEEEGGGEEHALIPFVHKLSDINCAAEPFLLSLNSSSVANPICNLEQGSDSSDMCRDAQFISQETEAERMFSDLSYMHDFTLFWAVCQPPQVMHNSKHSTSTVPLKYHTLQEELVLSHLRGQALKRTRARKARTPFTSQAVDKKPSEGKLKAQDCGRGIANVLDVLL